MQTLPLTYDEQEKVAQLMNGDYGTCEFCGQPLNEDGECRSACDERRPPLPDYIRERPDLWVVPEKKCWHGVPFSECPHYHGGRK